MKKPFPTIELLESRIAPASVFVYTDVDGNHVKITSSKGDLNAAGVVTLSNAGASAVGKGHVLQELDLGAAFAGASISITATPSDDLTSATTKTIQGDGFTDVGFINAPAIDLASVNVHGDLAKIVVGDSNAKTLGLGSLTVQSIGAFGTANEPSNGGTGTPDLISRFENGIGTITVNGDVNGAFLHAIATGAAPSAKIGKITIKGSLIGGSADDTGEIAGSDGIGSVTINGNIIGGAGLQSGRVTTDAGGNIGKIVVGGTIYGGSNNSSGIIDCGASIGSVTIKGDIVGGSAFDSGVILATTGINNATVTGSIIGGTFENTGGIDSSGTLGSVKVGGDLRGINFSSASDYQRTAFIVATGRISSVAVGGSLVAGVETGGGSLRFSGSIQSGQELGSVTVGGGVIGNSTTAVVISGLGQATKKMTSNATDLAIQNVSVAGTVDYALIEGGYDTTGAGTDGDAQIGALKVGGDLVATSIVSGILSVDPSFGLGDSVIATNNQANILSKIASITVGGQIIGTIAAGDSFGIEAQAIGSIKTGGVSLALQPGAGNDDIFISQVTTHDVHIHEFGGT